MNLEQVEVFVQYLCGDIVKVTVPAISVGVPTVPAFTMPIIGECPEGTMADPRTYVSSLYPVLSNDTFEATADMLGLLMKYIYIAYQYPTSNAEYMLGSQDITAIYLKNINISKLTNDGLYSSQDLVDIYLKSINIAGSTSDSLGSSHDIMDLTFIDLNRYYTVQEGFTSSSTPIDIAFEESPRLLVGLEIADLTIDSYTPSVQLVSGLLEVFANFDNLRGDLDTYTTSANFISGSIVTYNNYSTNIDIDGYSVSAGFVSGNMETYTARYLTGDMDGYITSATFISGTIQNV